MDILKEKLITIIEFLSSLILINEFFLARTCSPSLLESDNMDRMITLFMITLSGSGFHYTVIEHNPS